MKKLEIFDPAMCCSTGVCGPAIDPELLRVSTVVSALEKKGISIIRHNLASAPQDFVANSVISDLLQKEGADVLPVTLLDGEVVKTKAYPTNEEFSQWLDTIINVKPIEKKTGGCCCSGNEGCC